MTQCIPGLLPSFIFHLFSYCSISCHTVPSLIILIHILSQCSIFILVLNLYLSAQSFILVFHLLSYCSIFYHTVLSFIILFYVLSYCSIFYHTVLSFIILFYLLSYCSIFYLSVPSFIILFYFLSYCSILYCTILCHTRSLSHCFKFYNVILSLPLFNQPLSY